MFLCSTSGESFGDVTITFIVDTACLCCLSEDRLAAAFKEHLFLGDCEDELCEDSEEGVSNVIEALGSPSCAVSKMLLDLVF